ncbi:hypothetical protein [uncultured Clostridium sp.]|uniref:hypothetical protein n=1 Tax=uncultured Clostridium sp. TaxID=59620 RepID=UPI0028E27156|nr:hypothetical protein [uncultured Clostridium sp.]
MFCDIFNIIYNLFIYITEAERLKAISSLGTLIVGIFAAKKYFYERNRELYIKRLNEVYAPLYSCLVKQETIRNLYTPDKDIKNFPILTLTFQVKNTKQDLTGGAISKETSEENILDRKHLLDIINDTNKGLATPNLLILINAYGILVNLEEKLKEGSEEWEKATRKKVEVEYKLFKEVVNGYENTIKKLKLDYKYRNMNLEEFNI